MRVGTATKTYHEDRLRTARGLTDSTQAATDSRDYDAFGMQVATAGTSTTRFGFAGGHGYPADVDGGLTAHWLEPSVRDVRTVG